MLMNEVEIIQTSFRKAEEEGEKSEATKDAEIGEIIGMECMFRLERADNARTRQLYWHPTQSNDVEREPFRKEEAYEAPRCAVESLHEYDESIHKFF